MTVKDGLAGWEEEGGKCGVAFLGSHTEGGVVVGLVDR